jgi:ABC-type nitrate/sulfonate/bicarbonate transport system permease component
VGFLKVSAADFRAWDLRRDGEDGYTPACLGATPIQAFLHVTLPAILPFMLTGMRLAMGNSFATVLSAGMIAADTGLGFLFLNARRWMSTDKIFIGIVCLGLR